MIFIYQHNETKEIKVSNIFIATIPDQGWQGDGIFDATVWNYGICNYYESQYFDILPDHTLSFYHNDLQRLVNEGHLILKPTEKLINNQIVEKTIEEQYSEKIISEKEYSDYLTNKRIEKQNQWRSVRESMYILYDRNHGKYSAGRLTDSEWKQVVDWSNIWRDMTKDDLWKNDLENWIPPVKPDFVK